MKNKKNKKSETRKSTSQTDREERVKRLQGLYVMLLDAWQFYDGSGDAAGCKRALAALESDEGNIRVEHEPLSGVENEALTLVRYVVTAASNDGHLGCGYVHATFDKARAALGAIVKTHADDKCHCGSSHGVPAEEEARA